jgi:DNA-nicking Smr family endonuclease
MKSSKGLPRYRPFQKLDELIDARALPVATEDTYPASGAAHGVEGSEGSQHVPDEEALFEEAMKDVVPMRRPSVPTEVPKPRFPCRELRNSDGEVVASLKDLVRHGQGFVVSDTPEYMEGVGYGVDRRVADRLHRGDFSIQDHLDLHGLVVEEAKEVFDDFLRQSIMSSKRALLVIHGRGLSSTERPVLKTKVKEWLTSGLWRKWVVAFSSARACDGGAGATYILLRRYPATKRYRKR